MDTVRCNKCGDNVPKEDTKRPYIRRYSPDGFPIAPYVCSKCSKKEKNTSEIDYSKLEEILGPIEAKDIWDYVLLNS